MKIIFGILCAIGLILTGFSPLSEANSDLEQIQLEEFQRWAGTHDISLIGINKSSDELLEFGYSPQTDKIPIENVHNVLVVFDTLYQLPSSVLDSMEGKTIYFSAKEGRGLAVISSQDKFETVSEMNDGFIIEQSINPYYVLHELGHVVDLSNLKNQEIKKEIFKIKFNSKDPSIEKPKGFISYYSMKNQEENFAEHFTHYVLYPDQFREEMQNDPKLVEKYLFFKNFIFNGIEFY